MTKSEDQVLDELLGSQRTGWLQRLLRIAFSLGTLTLLLVLSVLIMREIHLSEQEAYESHRAERRVQLGLTAAHDVQTSSAEQFLSFNAVGAPDPCQPRGGAVDVAACGRRAGAILDHALQGRFVGVSELRSLRTFATLSDAAEAERTVAQAVTSLNSLERWVVPLATDVDRFVEDPYYAALLDTVDTQQLDSPRASALRARVHALPLQVAGTPDARRPYCERILWDGDDAVLISPETSLEVLIWQAECLRKDPSLIDRSFTSAADATAPDEPDADALRAAAMIKGRRAAVARFQQAVDAIEAPPERSGRRVCGVELDPDITVGLRTFATSAARAYNGLAMTLITGQPTEASLDAARDAIRKAVCFRKEAKQTAAVQAGSQENLAVIAYKRAHLALEAGNEPAAWHAFKEARCEAERAVRDNPLLPWSWTVLYITETALRSPWSDEEIDCEAMFRIDVRYKRRAIPAIWRKLTFFAPTRFAPDELPTLLPLATSPSPFNETGFDDLEALLEAQDAEHARVEAYEDTVWTQILGLPEQLGSLARTGGI